METLFNIAWAVIGILGIGAGLWFRRRLAPWSARELARDVLLLAAIVFLLFPIISVSDDIGYFSYYLSRGQAPDSLFWVSGPRREKQLLPIVVLQVFALLLVAVLSAFRQRTILGLIPISEQARTVDRSATATFLRAPPSSLF